MRINATCKAHNRKYGLATDCSASAARRRSISSPHLIWSRLSTLGRTQRSFRVPARDSSASDGMVVSDRLSLRPKTTACATWRTWSCAGASVLFVSRFGASDGLGVCCATTERAGHNCDGNQSPCHLPSSSPRQRNRSCQPLVLETQVCSLLRHARSEAAGTSPAQRAEPAHRRVAGRADGRAMFPIGSVIRISILPLPRFLM